MEIWKKMWVGVFFLNTVYNIISILSTLIMQNCNMFVTVWTQKTIIMEQAAIAIIKRSQAVAKETSFTLCLKITKFETV